MANLVKNLLFPQNEKFDTAAQALSAYRGAKQDIIQVEAELHATPHYTLHYRVLKSKLQSISEHMAHAMVSVEFLSGINVGA